MIISQMTIPKLWIETHTLWVTYQVSVARKARGSRGHASLASWLIQQRPRAKTYRESPHLYTSYLGPGAWLLSRNISGGM